MDLDRDSRQLGEHEKEKQGKDEDLTYVKDTCGSRAQAALFSFLLSSSLRCSVNYSTTRSAAPFSQYCCEALLGRGISFCCAVRGFRLRFPLRISRFGVSDLGVLLCFGVVRRCVSRGGISWCVGRCLRRCLGWCVCRSLSRSTSLPLRGPCFPNLGVLCTNTTHTSVDRRIGTAKEGTR